jgi:capsular polysaccharide biosynthesis protein
VLAERCYQALDHDRIELHDITGRCAVASAGAAAMGLGVQVIVVKSQVPKLRHERALALACGFDFHVGVRREEHKEALEEEAPDLIGLIVVMDWC